MKAHGTKSSEASGTNHIVERKTHATSFAKVLDGRKQPIRGLWVRNGRYYARLAVEDANTGLKDVRRVPLRDTDGNPVETVPQAVAAFERLRTQRADDALPQLGQTPKFSDYVTTYLEAITKKDGTVEKEESTLDLWKEHIGHLRLDKIKPVHVASFVQKRLFA
jgi:hypothetical protein